MRPPIRGRKFHQLFWGLVIIIIVLGIMGKLVIYVIPETFPLFLAPAIETLQQIPFYSFMVAVILISFALIVWGFRHKLYTRGIKYALLHMRILLKVKKSLHEAKYYIVTGFKNKSARLPKIKIKLSKDYMHGEIQLENHIQWEKPYENICLSSSLIGGYIIEESYITDDGNNFVYKFSHIKTQRQEVFTNAEKFLEWSRCGDYEMKIDTRNAPIELTSLLCVGTTGSGKSLSLINLNMQCLAKQIPYYFYYADPKMTDLGNLGKSINAENTAESIEDIIELMRKFYNAMESRKPEYQKMLRGHYSVDYRDFALSPHIFLMEEASSVFSFIGKMDKSIRDEFSAMLKAIVLQGRALGFFLWCAMQKSDATSIPTEIRENLPCKIILARGAEQTTVVTLFGVSAQIPSRKYLAGQGCYITPATGSIKLCFFPTLNFNVPCEISKLASEKNVQVPEHSQVIEITEH